MRDNNLEYLANYGLVSRWIIKQYGLKRADLELLFYLHDLKIFTRGQFEDGEMLYCWDKNRFYDLLKKEFIKVTNEGDKLGGNKKKYSLTASAVRMLRRMDRILDGKEDIPLSIRNKTMSGKRYSDKVLATSIKNKYD